MGQFFFNINMVIQVVNEPKPSETEKENFFGLMDSNFWNTDVNLNLDQTLSDTPNAESTPIVGRAIPRFKHLEL